MGKRKFLSFVLSAMIIASSLFFLNASVFAQEVSDGFIYRVETADKQKEAILTGLENSVSGDVVIPDTLGGYSVVKIEGAFKNKSGITSVSMPDTVKVISKEAFYGCSLESIHLSAVLSHIYESAFYSCVNLEAVEMPDSVTTIGPYAFSYCTALRDVVFSGGLSFIDKEMFIGCSELLNIDIPDSVNYISHNAFKDTKYYRTDSNWESGVLYLNGHIIAAKTTVSGRYVVKNGTKSVSDYAFIGCRELNEICFPVELKRIGATAFMNCEKLKHVFYSGNEDRMRSITIEKNNSPLLNAVWFCEYNADAEFYYPCDINGDGEINNKDLTRLFQYLSGWKVDVKYTVLDVNGDKKVNNKDLTRLLKYLSGFNVRVYKEHLVYYGSNGDFSPVVSF